MRRLLAGFALTLGLVAASLAWWGFTLDRTVGDPARTARVTDVLLQDEAVQNGFVDATATAINQTLPPEARGLISRAQIDAAARAAVESPATQDDLRATLAQVHSYVVGAADQPPLLSAGALDAAVRQQLVALDPALAPSVAAMAPLAIRLPDQGLEVARTSREWLADATRIAAIVACLAVAVALVTSPRRSAIMRRAGWWALVTGGLWVVLRFAVPPLAAEVLPAGAGLIGGLATAASESMLWPGLILVAAGNILFLGGSLVDWGARERRARVDHRPTTYGDAGWATTVPEAWQTTYVDDGAKPAQPAPAAQPAAQRRS